MANRRGFTYIELTVALIVLLLIVGLIMPSLKNLAKGEEIVSFKTDLKSLPVSAREFAISRGQTVEIAYDDQSSEITVRSVEETASAGQTSTGSSSESDGQGSDLRTIAIPETIDPTSFMVDGSDADAGTWAIRFYADGTSESGGIGFDASGYEFSLTIRGDGHGATVDGDIPDLSTEKWKAGDYEQRTQ